VSLEKPDLGHRLIVINWLSRLVPKPTSIPRARGAGAIRRSSLLSARGVLEKGKEKKATTKKGKHVSMRHACPFLFSFTSPRDRRISDNDHRALLLICDDFSSLVRIL
jgi:hypothetical protein